MVPFKILRPLNTRCRITVRTQKGATILTTTHLSHGTTAVQQAYGTDLISFASSKVLVLLSPPTLNQPPKIGPCTKTLKGPHKHKDPTNHDFWYPPSSGPWNQNVRSLCLCGLFGPLLTATLVVPGSLVTKRQGRDLVDLLPSEL